MTLKQIARQWFRFRRLVLYVTLAQSAMVGALFFDRYGWEWLLLSPVALVLLYFLHQFDTKYALPTESEVTMRDNPQWQEILTRLRRIDEKLS